MPRNVTEELVGYSMNVQTGERQVVQDGMPVFNGTGEPKTEPLWLMQFIGRSPMGDQHLVQFAMTKDGKDALVRALTGVQPASAIDLPAGIEL